MGIYSIKPKGYFILSPIICFYVRRSYNIPLYGAIEHSVKNLTASLPLNKIKGEKCIHV